MNKNIFIMAIAMVAMLAFGGTYAFFSATANSHSSDVTTGTIRLVSGKTQTVKVDSAVKGDSVLGTVSFDATGTTAKSFVFITMSATITPNDVDLADGNDENNVKFADIFNSELTVQGTWSTLTKADISTLDENTTVYYTVIETGSNLPFLSALTVNATANWVEEYDENGDLVNNMPNVMDVDIDITISGKAIQYNGFVTATGALDEETGIKATTEGDIKLGAIAAYAI